MLRKTLIVSIVCIAGAMLWSCSEAQEGKSRKGGVTASMDDKELSELPKTTIKFKDTVYNFGETPQGTPVTHSFEFTNTGKYDLVIVDAKPTCGCTASEWPKEPIPPGQTRSITATYDAKGKDMIHKSIVVTANTEQGIHKLLIEGYVKEKVNILDPK